MWYWLVKHVVFYDIEKKSLPILKKPACLTKQQPKDFRILYYYYVQNTLK